MKRTLPLIGVIILILTSLSCRRDTQDPGFIPDVPVSLYVYPNDPLFFDLQLIGGWVYIEGGVRGILVYRSDFNEFIAYERACPSVPLEDCSRIEVQSDNFTAICPCDSTTYQIIDGLQISGPGGGLPLKRYQTSFDGNTLYIFN